ncbi:lipoprotein 17-related variable surface protein [[Mycoplasma] mobile]|uniref:Expressed protein n=1 Tax=Mycoplasma mobile (strain ATCC 43663 / 163K / NCTC 11711) TaxID=267748 RepID=Q6KHX4_MYCM1|nr:lipoprotein 17-related variable surface protein [[Mycoplasma] mobile]AAT27802.1 expressed protein [Mycoplasma mobile 163K]
MNPKTKKKVLIGSLVTSIVIIPVAITSTTLSILEKDKNESEAFLRKNLELVNRIDFNNLGFDKNLLPENIFPTNLASHFLNHLPEKNLIEYDFIILNNLNINSIEFQIKGFYKNIEFKTQEFNLELNSISTIIENYLNKLKNFNLNENSLEIEKRKKINPLKINSSNINKFIDEEKILSLPKMQKDFTYSFEYIENSSDFIEGTLKIRAWILYKNEKFSISNNPMELSLKNFLTTKKYFENTKQTLLNKSEKLELQVSGLLSETLPSIIEKNSDITTLIKNFLNLNEQDVSYIFTNFIPNDKEGTLKINVNLSYLNQFENFEICISNFRNNISINELNQLISEIIITPNENLIVKDFSEFNNGHFDEQFLKQKGISLSLQHPISIKSITNLEFKNSNENQGSTTVILTFKNTLLSNHTFIHKINLSGFQKSDELTRLEKLVLKNESIFVLKKNDILIENELVNQEHLKINYGIRLENIDENLFSLIDFIEIKNTNITEGSAEIEITLKNNLGSFTRRYFEFKKGTKFDLLQYTTFEILPNSFAPLKQTIFKPSIEKIKHLNINFNFIEKLSFEDLEKIEISNNENGSISVEILIFNDKSKTFIISGFASQTLKDIFENLILKIDKSKEAIDILIIPENGSDFINSKQLQEIGISLNTIDDESILKKIGISSIKFENSNKRLGFVGKIEIRSKILNLTKTFNNVNGFFINPLFVGIDRLKIRSINESTLDKLELIIPKNNTFHITKEQLSNAGIEIDFNEIVSLEDVLFIRFFHSQTINKLDVNRIFINVQIQLKNSDVNKTFNDLLFKTNLENSLNRLNINVLPQTISKNTYLIASDNFEENKNWLNNQIGLEISTLDNLDNILNWSSILSIELKQDLFQEQFASLEIKLKNGLSRTIFLSGFATTLNEINKMEIRALSTVFPKDTYIFILENQNSITEIQLANAGLEINFMNDSILSLKDIEVIKIDSSSIFGSASVLIYFKNGLSKKLNVIGFKRDEFAINLQSLRLTTINSNIPLVKQEIIIQSTKEKLITFDDLSFQNLRISNPILLKDISEIKINPNNFDLGIASVLIIFKNGIEKNLSVSGFKTHDLIKALDDIEISGNNLKIAKNIIIVPNTTIGNTNITIEQLNSIGLNLKFNDFLNLSHFSKIEIMNTIFGNPTINISLKDLNYTKTFNNVLGFRKNSILGSWNASSILGNNTKILTSSKTIWILNGNQNITQTQLDELGIMLNLAIGASINDIESISISPINNSSNAFISIRLKIDNIIIRFNDVSGFLKIESNKLVNLRNSFVATINKSFYPNEIITILKNDQGFISQDDLDKNNLRIAFANNISLNDIDQIQIIPNFSDHSVSIKISLKNDLGFHTFTNITDYLENEKIASFNKSFVALINSDSFGKNFNLSIDNGFVFSEISLRENNLKLFLFDENFTYEHIKTINVTKISNSIHIVITLDNGFVKIF